MSVGDSRVWNQHLETSPNCQSRHAIVFRGRSGAHWLKGRCEIARPTREDREDVNDTRATGMSSVCRQRAVTALSVFAVDELRNHHVDTFGEPMRSLSPACAVSYSECASSHTPLLVAPRKRRPESAIRGHELAPPADDACGTAIALVASQHPVPRRIHSGDTRCERSLYAAWLPSAP